MTEKENDRTFRKQGVNKKKKLKISRFQRSEAKRKTDFSAETTKLVISMAPSLSMRVGQTF